jgi:hypothetical protein
MQQLIKAISLSGVIETETFIELFINICNSFEICPNTAYQYELDDPKYSYCLFNRCNIFRLSQQIKTGIENIQGSESFRRLSVGSNISEKFCLKRLFD